MISVPQRRVLLLEIRDQTTKTVSFNALNLETNSFLWTNLVLDEPWWVSLAGAEDDTMLFTIYLEHQNPDKKGILAYGIHKPSLRWWNNDFSLVTLNRKSLLGYSLKMGQKLVLLDLQNGQELLSATTSDATPIPGPVQYLEGTTHFNTVKTFLDRKLNLSVVSALEYFEYDDKILVSYYVTENGLANYLIVFDTKGTVRLHEKLDEHLKGIGLDTFFVLSGCVIFVKNREELVSYFL
ncbi:DUF4905 domain-containing protein [Pseudochryseolinea flava]|uniref:DUF4905 domain-containing protein n=1 Tax=Pseudochryseolinea flava TaxID=2059302 RepID=A0A364XVU7_9BACT|nr:DUF4905 domain-containing protein [Pseudochryseolinea flava]RAV98306.1 hypothetical protein DQQ10_24465 [Pseudochryseolinea flava]